MTQRLLLGEGLRFLVPATLEQTLYSNIAEAEADLVQYAKRLGAVCLDLSLIERFDPGAVVQLVVLTEALLQAGCEVEIRLPHRREIEAEQAWIEEVASDHASEAIAQRVKRRNQAYNALMEYLGFGKALAHSHIEELIKLHGGSLSLTESPPGLTHLPHKLTPTLPHPEQEQTQEQAPPPLPPMRPQEHHVPLTWLSAPEPGSEAVDNEAIDTAAAAIWDAFRGILGSYAGQAAGIDRNALGEVILKELIENVLKHAGASRWGLIAASAYAPGELDCWPDDWFMACDQEFLGWYRQTGAPLIEVHVGDAGVGIVNTLRSAFQAFEADGSTNQILQWAFQRYATSEEQRQGEIRTGLHRVERLANHHRGMVTVRSADGLAGWDHGGPAYDSPVACNDPLAWLPGSVHRIRLPVAPDRLQQPRSFAPSPEPPQIDLLAWRIEESEESEGALPNELIATLRRSFTAPRTTPLRCILLALEVTPTPKAPRAWVEQVVTRLAKLPDRGVIICHGLPGGWELLQSVIEQGIATEDPEAPLDGGIPPLLLLGEGSQARWLGGEPKILGILDRLIQTGKPLARAELADLAQADQATVEQQLLAAGHLITLDRAGTVALRFSLTDLWQRLGNALREHLEMAVAEEPPGKRYRTPSLVLVRHWIKPDALFPGQQRQLYALALALKVQEHAAAGQLVEPTALVVDTTTADADARAIGQALAIRQRIPLSGEGDEPSSTEGHLIPDHPNVLIFNEILYSGETVVRFIKQAMRDKAHPVLVAAYVDAREHKRDTIPVFGAEIPVVALCSLDLVMHDPEAIERAEIEEINPIVKDIESGLVDALPEASLDQLDPFRETVDRARALHLGHTGGVDGRHFTFFLNPAPLLADAQVRGEILTAIDEWHQVNCGPDEAIALLYPESTHVPSIRQLASWLEGQRPWIARHEAIPRQWDDGSFRLASAAKPPKLPASVVIIDWGVMTGNSLRHLIRIAAQGGAQRILSCIYVSQLPLEDHQFFEMLTQLRTSTGRAEITTRFLHRFPTGFYAKDNCPVCCQLRELTKDAGPTPLLARFAQQERERLNLLGREERIETWSVAAGEGEALSWMVRVRSLLESARQFTRTRQRVVDCLEELYRALEPVPAELPEKPLWLLRLLALESQWLRRPPLHFEGVRSRLADIAEAVLNHPHCPARYRPIAIAIFRSAHKRRFARTFQELFERFHRSTEDCAPLLHHAYTYLSRHYHRAEQMLQPLEDQVDAILLRLTQRELNVTQEIQETLQHFKTRLLRELAETHAEQLSPVEAWRALRRALEHHYDRSVNHHTLAYNFRRLLPQAARQKLLDRLIEAIENKVPPDEEELATLKEAYFDSLEEHWSPCRDFLDQTLLPHLQPLVPVLEGYDAGLKLGPENIRRLTALAQEPTTIEQHPFARLVRRFAQEPEAALTHHNWERFTELQSWLWTTVFRHEEGQVSKLWGFLHSAPTELGQALTKAFTRWREEVEFEVPNELPGLSDIAASPKWLFCPASLMSDLILQLFENTEKHAIPGLTPRVWLEHEQIDQERFRLIFLYANTQPGSRAKRGHGLTSLRRRLKAFGGQLLLNARRYAQPEVTFAVEVEFTEVPEP